jgi:hypothetical protein
LTPTSAPTPDLPTQIVALGREGLAYVEIAAALGLGVRELEGVARGDAAVELALDRAEAAAMAWWARAPRLAMAAGARFPWASWRRGVAWRADETEGSVRARPRSAAAAVRAPLARYEIPCNGKARPLPDGTCPDCGKRHRRPR